MYLINEKNIDIDKLADVDDEKINKAINTDRKQVCYIKPMEGLNGMTCQTLMHSFLYGHNGASLEQKLKEG